MAPRPSVILRGLLAGLVLDLALWGAGRLLVTRSLRRASPALEYRLENVEQPLKVWRRHSPKLARGWVLVFSPGQPEVWRCLVKIRRRGGVETREVVKKLKRLQRGMPLWVMLGTGWKPNPFWFPRVTWVASKMEVVATAYDPGPVDNSRGWVGTTSIGLRARFGIAAVDPRVVPYRTWMYVYGYGPAYAGDTGGAIRGRRLDLCYDSTRQALDWGRRRTRVLVLKGLGWRESGKILGELGMKQP